MKLALGRPIDHGWGLIEETAAERSGRRTGEGEVNMGMRQRQTKGRGWRDGIVLLK